MDNSNSTDGRNRKHIGHVKSKTANGNNCTGVAVPTTCNYAPLALANRQINMSWILFNFFSIMIIRLQCTEFCCPRIKSRAKNSGGCLVCICIHYNTNLYPVAQSKKNIGSWAARAHVWCDGRKCKLMFTFESHYHIRVNFATTRHTRLSITYSAWEN